MVRQGGGYGPGKFEASFLVTNLYLLLPDRGSRKKPGAADLVPYSDCSSSSSPARPGAVSIDSGGTSVDQPVVIDAGVAGGDPHRDDRYTYGHGFAMLFLSQVLGEEEDDDRPAEADAKEGAA